MRDYVLTYINGVRHEVRGSDARRSLSDYLRRQLGLVGTKIVCSEGDCGACSVLLGRRSEDGIYYQAVDACIVFLFQLDLTHIVTIEGLAKSGGLSAIQQAMVDCNGSQCGFCTPGFVMTMTGMAENGCTASSDSLKYGLTGNLCRCTGYMAIIEAGMAASTAEQRRIGEIFPPIPMLADFEVYADEAVEVTDSSGKSIFSPVRCEEALAYRSDNLQALIVSGATDIGVRVNKGFQLPDKVLALNKLTELTEIKLLDGKLVIGARASWTAVEAAYRDLVPRFHRILNVFGSPQIRNMGTIGGNIINASPIADSLPFLHVMDAELVLESKSQGIRTVSINEFYHGYKKFDLRPTELLTSIHVPLPEATDLLGLYKVSRRRDLDISSFTAAIRLRIDDNTISFARVTFGGVGPLVLRARDTESFLLGRSFSEATLREAGDLAAAEVAPISDVRGSADYRLRLARNVLLKFFFENQPELSSV
jgi:xanthine dehydrogenase small subunit